MAPTTISPFIQRTDTQIDWTDHLNGINDFARRLADAYLGNTFHSDMTFFVELDETSIPAHSLIIAAASPVLDRCIRDTNGTGGIVVTVPDCSLSEFNVMLRYLYTGIAEVHTIETATVLLSLAHYFDLRHFETICTDVIEKLMTPQNVCETFDRIHLMNIPLKQTCIQLMQTNIDELVSNGSLMRMKDPTVTEILTGNLVRIPCETKLFQAMLHWADEQCKVKNISSSSSNLRMILNNRISVDRFDGMTSDAFFKCISAVGCGFFSNDEIAAVCQRIAMVVKINDDSNPIYHHIYIPYPFCTIPSNEYTGIESIHRSKGFTREWSLLGFKSNADVISISAEKLDTTTYKIDHLKVDKWFMFTTPPESLLKNGVQVITLHITLLDPEDKTHVFTYREFSPKYVQSGFYSSPNTIMLKYMVC